MSKQIAWDVPFLPWVESENDRRFRKILYICVAVSVLLGLIVPFLPTSEPEQKELKTVSPRLAKLVLEQKKLPPPPVPKPAKKEAVKKKPVVEKKKPLKPKPVVKPKPISPKQQKAQEVAASSGLVALSDELMDMRDSFDLEEFEDQPLSTSGKKSEVALGKTSVISSKALSQSKGINTGSLTKSTAGSSLASRQTTAVKSNIQTGVAKKVARTASGKLTRPQHEIESVFQKNKGAIYSIYNRALRKDPSLQGKVVIELTIAGNGRVTKARIVSSELNNPSLERKLLARVKLFKFKPSNAAVVTVKYPIDFLPS